MINKIGNALKNFFKNIFKPTNWKRWIIIIFSLIASVFSIIFGFIFFINKNVNKNIDYNGGIKYQIVAKDNKDERVKGKELSDITKALEYRFSSLNRNDVTFNAKDNGLIDVSSNKNLNDEDLKYFENDITKKSTLVFTDLLMNPLFQDGKFVEGAKIDYNNIQRYAVPIKEGSAQARFNYLSNKYAIQVDLANQEAEIEFAKATKWVSQNGRLILMWLNLDELVQLAKTEAPEQWKQAGEIPSNFVFVNNTPMFNRGSNNNTNAQPTLNALKSEQFKADQYLIDISQINENNLYKSGSYQITGGILKAKDGGFKKTLAESITGTINFSRSDYKLNISENSKVIINSESPTYNFNFFWLASSIIFAILAIALTLMYGFLGIINSIFSALFIFLTLVMYIALNGVYSPLSLLGIYIGGFVGLFINIVFLNRIKREIIKGEQIFKAIKNASSKTFFASFDTIVVNLITSIIFFFVGSAEMQSFSIMISFSSIFSLVIMLLLARWITILVLQTGVFDKKMIFIGIRNSQIGKFAWLEKNNKHDIVNKTKFSIILPIVLLISGIVVYSVFASINKNGFSGVNLYNDFILDNFNLRYQLIKVVVGISIALTATLIYTFIRFKWTYVVTLFALLLINLLLLFSAITIARIKMDSTIIISFVINYLISLVIIYTIFGLLRDQISRERKREEFNHESIRFLSNIVVKQAMKNYLFYLIALVLSSLIYISFIYSNNIWLLINIILSVFISIYSIVLIGIPIWSKIEEIRFKNIEKRISSKYWDIPGVNEEQIFANINSFEA
ncbi:bifunctional preprotein translocase subunit SecD/SecF [Mycoplasmopsis maculosa]|uniref:Bifunctional preprotein translocase subunit SecD/SecF n=1 Tax=Mycoplasmopsis maculosa TaxID=114885 RepID=A0A449B5D9_9BACT|nr:hypothetical protein [Mycoplasmopsis maculosa]VEU75789.1 bifunctional preprotein translocase subunit SecD/SecF [Mycoplasmopsis maculosa]